MPAPPSAETCIASIRRAQQIWPFGAAYRGGPGLALSIRAIEAGKPADKAAALAELRRITAIDFGNARLLGHLVSFELDFGNKDAAERAFAQFRLAAQRGPQMKVDR